MQKRNGVNYTTVLLIGLALVGTLVLAMVGIRLLGIGSGGDQRPGEIANAPSASVEQSSSAAVETPRAPSPDVDVPVATKRLNECVNGATDYKDVRDHAYDCFLGYTSHLPNVYAIRDIGPVNVKDTKVSEGDTAKITATLVVGGNDAGTVEAYWVEGLRQFKVVDSQLNDWSEVRVREDVIKQVKNQA